jgi:hypothetical protein
MELLLNLAWMLLALPACWLWRRDAGLRLARRVSSLQCVLALGCALVLLFPVISASDDLHAMRAEMEESSTSKRTVRLASGEKHSAWVNRMQGPPALMSMSSALWLPTPPLARRDISIPCITPVARPCALQAGRAPPISPLA